jgi:hypothetical protein
MSGLRLPSAPAWTYGRGSGHAQNRQSCDLHHIVRGPEGAENMGLGEHSSRRGPVWPELPWPEVQEARAPRPQHRLLYQHFEAPSGHVTALLRVRTPLAARRHGGRHDPLTPRRSAGSGSRTYFPSLPGEQPHPTLGAPGHDAELIMLGSRESSRAPPGAASEGSQR